MRIRRTGTRPCRVPRNIFRRGPFPRQGECTPRHADPRDFLLLPEQPDACGLTLPRLNLLASGDPPANDSFSAAETVSGSSGTVSGVSWNATKESGEPDHAGSSGGASVWWKWTPSVSGAAVITTHGSGFDTLLAVYTGSSVGSLAQVAANDNHGSRRLILPRGKRSS